ncbi:MAG: glycosyltransferase [Verrucomicrobia bacterium]|nr:glycosyltransferase [Verrucomicrobiota bacterium]
MKTALVHDWLVGLGGAEKVLAALCELFDGPIHTLIWNKKLFCERQIETTFLQHLPFSDRYYPNLLPLFPLAIQSFDLSQYDLILSSSHSVAKSIKTRPGQKHICYCHTPMRYAWDQRDFYLKTLSPVKRALAAPILKQLRLWDQKTAASVTHFIANSHFVAQRIKAHYGRPSTVIYPPVETHLFSPSAKKEDYFVTCSRLVPYKRVDLIIKAFPEKKLLIIGDGPEMKKLKSFATPNIEFLGHLPHEKLRQVIAKAKAFIFAAEEDFGIAVVEAQAAGVPVIAYAKGGALETILNGVTGLLFEEQTPDRIMQTIEQFERFEFDSKIIQSHAQKYSKERFKHEIAEYFKTL